MVLLGFVLFVIGHTFIWFEFNSQLVYPWWRDKLILPVLLFGIPSDLFFWYGTRYIYDQTGEIWASRMLAFGASYLVFPLLTWVIANESPLTLTTIVCSILAFMIIIIQIKF